MELLTYDDIDVERLYVLSAMIRGGDANIGVIIEVVEGT